MIAPNQTLHSFARCNFHGCLKSQARFVSLNFVGFHSCRIFLLMRDQKYHLIAGRGKVNQVRWRSWSKLVGFVNDNLTAGRVEIKFDHHVLQITTLGDIGEVTAIGAGNQVVIARWFAISI